MPTAFGPWLVLGSGKPDAPCERMHAEYLTNALDTLAPVWAEPALPTPRQAASASPQETAAQTLSITHINPAEPAKG